jgi:hypothetical protein
MEPQPRYRITRDNAGYLQMEWWVDGRIRTVLPLEDEEALNLAKALRQALLEKGL